MAKVQCKKCRYLLKDKEGYNWCPNKTDDPDIDLIRDCEWYAVKTNADRIRAMTDEELAEWFAGHDAGLIANVLNNDYVEPTKGGWLEWLETGV